MQQIPFSKENNQNFTTPILKNIPFSGFKQSQIYLKSQSSDQDYKQLNQHNDQQKTCENQHIPNIELQNTPNKKQTQDVKLQQIEGISHSFQSPQLQNKQEEKSPQGLGIKKNDYHQQTKVILQSQNQTNENQGLQLYEKGLVFSTNKLMQPVNQQELIQRLINMKISLITFYFNDMNQLEQVIQIIANDLLNYNKILKRLKITHGMIKYLFGFYKYIKQWEIKEIIFGQRDQFSNIMELEQNSERNQRTLNTNFIKEICHIKFNKLWILNLQQIKLNNIQFISWLDCNQISQIILSGNEITNVKSLNKIRFQNLAQLYMESNFINQVNTNRIYFNQQITQVIFKVQCQLLRHQQYNNFLQNHDPNNPLQLDIDDFKQDFDNINNLYAKFSVKSFQSEINQNFGYFHSQGQYNDPQNLQKRQNIIQNKSIQTFRKKFILQPFQGGQDFDFEQQLQNEINSPLVINIYIFWEKKSSYIKTQKCNYQSYSKDNTTQFKRTIDSKKYR